MSDYGYFGGGDTPVPPDRRRRLRLPHVMVFDSLDFLGAQEQVVTVKHKFPIVLVWPFLRTLLILFLMAATWPRSWVALLFVSAITVLRHFHVRFWTLRGFIKGALLLVLVLSPFFLLAALPPIMGLLAGVIIDFFWMADSWAGWVAERFIVTSSRIWHPSGVWTSVHPSISILGVSFTDPIRPWYYKILIRSHDVGMMKLDTNVQEDIPLQLFGPVSGVTELNRQIQEARDIAIRRRGSIPPGSF